MSAAHNGVERLQIKESRGGLWSTPKPTRILPEKGQPPHETLQEVLEDHTFIDYGELGKYVAFHEQGIDHYGHLGARMITKLTIRGHAVKPTLQADLLVRFIMTKAQEAGHNPYQYISMYRMDHMTWEMAHAGYTEGSDRLLAWEKLMKSDRQHVERQTFRRHIRQLPSSPS